MDKTGNTSDPYQSGQIAGFEGIFTAPERAATYAAVKRLRDSGWLKTDDQIVLYNTGSGLKYV